MPGFARIEKKYRDKDVVFIGVGGFNEDGARMRLAMNKAGVDYRNTLDGPKIARDYGNISGIPTTVIIGRDGNIGYNVTGMLGEHDLEKQIKKLL